MKYLRKFATKADMADLEQPNVVLIGDTSEVLYNAVPNGVYIQHIDGKLYTTDAWVAKGFVNNEANGVAVVTSACSFVISKINYTDVSWGSTSVEVEGATIAANVTAAQADYKGFANTAAMMAVSASAASKCTNYTFPNGAKGYLPSAGEWYQAYRNKAKITEVLSIIGAPALYEYGSYWASTQRDISYAWRMGFGNGDIQASVKNSSFFARPFTTL